MNWAVLRYIVINRWLSFRDEINYVMELHNEAAMWDCHYLYGILMTAFMVYFCLRFAFRTFMVGFLILNRKFAHLLCEFLYIFTQVIYNESMQKFFSPGIHILPWLCLGTLVLSDTLTFFVGVLFPKLQGPTFQDATAFFPQLGSVYWFDGLNELGFCSNILECVLCSCKIAHICHVIFRLLKPFARLFSLFYAKFSQFTGLMPSEGACNVILRLTMAN